jgi:D-glycero-D-manno-heptose 1,7-bisphosphate phosphatase
MSSTRREAMSRALFLDRDGTLIFDKHYLSDPAGVELIPGTSEALRHARRLGYRLFILTNQSGIARGLLTIEDVHRCNARMEQLLGLPEPAFDGICIAPEGPDEPPVYRKPSPRYLLESIEQYHLDANHCWMVGDREADITTGHNAKIKAAAVCTGKHSSSEWAALKLPGVPIYADLLAFVKSLPGA